MIPFLLRQGDAKRIVSAGHDMTVKVWDAGTGAEMLFLKGHTAPVICVGFTVDGKFIVSCSGGQRPEDGPVPGEVKVWDVETGAAVFSLDRHTGPIASVALSPDGARIVTGGADGTVKVWLLDVLEERRRAEQRKK